MILSALCNLYDVLVADETSNVSRTGYSTVPCSYVLVLSKSGEYKGLISLTEGKVKKNLIVPEQKTRSGKNPPPYFLCDNAKYILGYEFDKKTGKLLKTTERLKSAYEFYNKIAKNSTDDGINAVLSFLKNRVDNKPLNIAEDDKIYQSGNIVFMLDREDIYIHDRKEVKT